MRTGRPSCTSARPATRSAPTSPTHRKVTPPPVVTASVDHVAFRCSGYRETVAKLSALGIPSHEAEIPGTGHRQIFVDGPDVTFELIFTPADVAG